MLPILLGLVLAMLFGLMSFLVYGLDGLVNHPWVDAVFWGLIVTGAFITLINEVGQCLLCKINQLLSFDQLSRFCNDLTCTK
jgi:hypothetical protein